MRAGQVPQLDPQTAKKTFAAVHRAIHAGLVRACHDLSEGGLAVATAEMAFAGGLGADIEAWFLRHVWDIRILRRPSVQRIEYTVPLRSSGWRTPRRSKRPLPARPDGNWTSDRQ